MNSNCLCTTCLQKNGIPTNICINDLAPLLVASLNGSAAKPSSPAFFLKSISASFLLPQCWWVPHCCGWDSGVISLGLVSLLHMMVLFRCHDCKAVLSNLPQYSEKIDSLTESIQCNTFLLAWSKCRLKQNRVAYYTTPFAVNLDLDSHSRGGESGCI